MPFVNPVIVIGLALPIAVYLALFAWQVTWYCTEGAAAEFVWVNVIATVPSLALTSRIETALGRAGAGSGTGSVVVPRTGSVVVPQARVDRLRKNADSNDGFMRISHQGVRSNAPHKSFPVRPEQRNDARTEKKLAFLRPDPLWPREGKRIVS